MQLKPLVIATTLALASATATATPWATYDARAAGMGGLSIATSNIDAAPFNNPAMLAAGEKDDSFGLLVSGGAGLGDPNDFQGALTDFQTAFDTLSGTPSTANLTAAQTALANLAGKDVYVDLGGGLATSFKWGQWAAALSVGLASNNDFGVNTTDGLAATIDLSANTNAQLQALSVTTQDIGLSLARSFELGDGYVLAVGVTPKLQTLTVGEFTQALNLADPTNLTATFAFETGSSSFNTDAGAVLRILDDVKVGVTMRNLLGGSYTTTTGHTVDIQPQMRAGIAYNTKLFTVGVDLDLTENSSYVSGAKSRYMIIGTELNAWDIAQLRLGYRSNTLNSEDVQVSAGVGLFNAVNIGAMTNPSNPEGGTSAFLSFGFKF